jgi:predicted component of type VI protein secretion system
MTVRSIISPQRFSGLALVAALALSGCKSTPPAPDDASLNSAITARLASDPNLNGQSVQTSVSGGVVTVTGTVTSDTARNIAGQDIGQIAGVKTVVNNLLVQPSQTALAPATATTVTPPPPPAHETRQQKAERLREEREQREQHQPPTAAPIERAAPPPAPQPQPQPQAPIVAQAPPPPPPPPAPVVHNITLPAGTALPVRITETLDSATTQTGDKFTGAIASDIIVDGLVVLPQGTPVTGHVDAVQDAAHFKGSSLLTISLGAINRKGERIQVATEAYTKEGEGRGKNTAEKVGGGAAVGAILGGIFGGGKGAAIGAAAGGGVGAGANGVTRGQQVQIPSETVVRFKLTDPIIVHINSGGASNESDSGLERRNNQ